YCQQRSNWPPT
nr:immunoglobulin light chain junction region [Homo sapiens]